MGFSYVHMADGAVSALGGEVNEQRPQFAVEFDVGVAGTLTDHPLVLEARDRDFQGAQRLSRIDPCCRFLGTNFE